MEIILEYTKKKIDTVERLLDYLSDILFSIEKILDVVYLSDTGTYILIQKEILLKRDHASQEELLGGVYLDLNILLNSTKSYIELKKSNEFKFSFLDTYEELESLISKPNFEKLFLLLLGKIYNLEKFYEKLLPRVKNLIPKISILHDCYANPKYFNTKFPISDHQLEIFFESDLKLIKERIRFFLTDFKAEIISANTNHSKIGDGQSGQLIHKTHPYPTVTFHKKSNQSAENGTTERLYLFFKIVNPKFIKKENSEELSKMFGISSESYSRTIKKIEESRESNCDYFYKKENLMKYLPKVRDWIELIKDKKFIDTFYTKYPFIKLDS